MIKSLGAAQGDKQIFVRISLCVALLLAVSIKSLRADNGTWNSTPVNADYNNPANWSSGTVPNGAADSATFGPSNETVVSLSAATEVDTINTIASAPEYYYLTYSNSLTFSGSGIVNNSANTQNYFVNSLYSLNGAYNAEAPGQLDFSNSASVQGPVVIINYNNVAPASGSEYGNQTFFKDSSDAGSALILNYAGDRNGASTAQNSESGDSPGATIFSGTASADSSQIVNNGIYSVNEPGGATFFTGNSTAGHATILQAGSTTVTDNNLGAGLFFQDNSTAAQATIINQGGVYSGAFEDSYEKPAISATVFLDTASAGSARIENQAGRTGGNYGATFFSGNTTAGSATITNDASSNSNAGPGGITFFEGNSTAANAQITSNGSSIVTGPPGFSAAVMFLGSSTAGNATLIANSGSGGGYGGGIYFEASSTGGTAHVDVEGNGGLDLTQHNPGTVSIGALYGSGQVRLGATNLSVGADAGSYLFSGAIQGTGGFTKTGSSKLTLSGASTYLGPTTVSGGDLQVDGSIISDTTIASGGKMQGDGTVGAITLSSGGVLAPGDTTGTLTAASLLWNGGGKLEFTLGSGPDLLALTEGDVLKGDPGTFVFQLNDGGVVAGNTYDLITGIKMSDFALTDLGYDSGGAFTGNFGIVPEGNGIVLQFTVISVPEPSTWALLVLSLFLVIFVASRRQRA